MRNENTKERVSFRYKITYDEAYETFYLILDRRGNRMRYLVSMMLGLISVSLIWKYIKEPENITYSFLAFFCTLFIFWVLGAPHLKAKKGAKFVCQNDGNYEVKIQKNGCIYLKGNVKIMLNGDKDARAYETKQLFAVRTDREHTFCLPKRMMNLSEEEFVRDVLKEHIPKYRNR